MGGILIWGSTLLVVGLTRVLSYFGILEHSLINRKDTYLPLFTLITVALLGALDAYLNIKHFERNKVLRVTPKFLWLVLFATLGAFWFYFKLGYDQIHVTGMGDFFIGAWYIPLFIFIIVATSNAVNFTDGLDGLAGGLAVIAFSSFAAIAYMKGLLILTAFCAVIAGATLAFLWFNIYPARFFMGDTGAMSLGVTLGIVAMLTNSLLLLPIIGLVFVLESLSVIVQVLSKKIRQKKVFLSAPFHHHLEAKGWSEPTIVMRLWVVAAASGVLGLIISLLDR
jgi:phospho-N-acetylmuramoyl-pentapeptide-transferase